MHLKANPDLQTSTRTFKYIYNLRTISRTFKSQYFSPHLVSHLPGCLCGNVFQSENLLISEGRKRKRKREKKRKKNKDTRKHNEREKEKKKRKTNTKMSTIKTIGVSPQICRIWEPRTCELAIFRGEYI